MNKRNGRGSSNDSGGKKQQHLKYSEAVERLQKSQEKYRLFFEMAHDAFLVLKEDVFVDCNSRALELFDCQREDLIGEAPYDFSPEKQPDGRKSRDKAIGLIQKAMAGEPQFFYWKHQKKTGEYFDAEVSLNSFELEGEQFLITSNRDVTERVSMQEELDEYRRRVHDIIQFLPDATFVIDLERKVVAWNKAMEEMTGMPAEEVVGQGDYIYALPFYGLRRPVLADLVLEDNAQRDEEIKEYYDAVWKQGNKYYCETLANALYDNSGAYIWATASPIFNAEGQMVGAIESVRDITDFKRSQEALRESEEKYREILSTIEEGYYEVDLAGNFVFCNDSLCRIGGYPRDELINMSYKDIYSDPQAVYETYNKVFRTGEPEKAVGWPITTKDGQEKFIEVSVSLRKDKTGQPIGFRGVARDITERKKVEEQLKYLSMHDHLTGLYNRMYFEEELTRINNARHYPITIMVCDVDGLKLVNDTLGHKKGDELLQAAACLIKGPLRASDVVARIGGDEFGVVIPNTGEEAAAGIVERIHKDIDSHNREKEDLPIGISIGWVISVQPVVSLTDLLKQADDNMYKEKLQRSDSTRENIIEGFMKLLAQKDYLTSGHGTRLQEISSMLGQEVGISVSEMGSLLLLAQVHDLGMVAVPDSILQKQGELDEVEWEEIKRHPEVGCRIARASSRLAHVADLILQHHEWWNGQGYPRGLRGQNIHICARILALADAYEVMTSGRPYKKALSHDSAVQELQRCKGTQFDPGLVEILIARLDEKIKRRQ